MKILSPQTLPPKEPARRRHRPRPAKGWSRYRPCLRWDFGFTCPFCLLHEADFYGGQPGEGLGGTTVEHWIPRSTDPEHQDEYENCLYACRFCNRSRSATPLWGDGVRLLDPTCVAWGDHFAAAGEFLAPAPGDADATYTHRTYELDDPRKVVRRRLRREVVTDRLALLQFLGGEIEALLNLAAVLRERNAEAFGEALWEIRQLWHEARRALKDLGRFPAIPSDAPEACRCPEPPPFRLPPALEAQTLEIDI